MNDNGKSKETTLHVQSGVNQKGEPFVQITQDGRVLAQLTPGEAAHHAFLILEATEACQSDAFLVAWVTEHVGAGQEQAAGLLADFRKWRGEMTGKQWQQDWVVNPTQVTAADENRRVKKL